MGRALGNYVHLEWDNYLEAGTYRKEIWNTTQKQTDFDNGVFLNYMRVLRAHSIHKTLNLKQQELKRQEQIFNTRRDQRFQELLDLSLNDQEQMIRLVLNNANLGKDFPLEEAMHYLTLDPASETIAIKKMNSIALSAQNLTLLKSGNYSTFQGLKQRFDAVRALITELPDGEEKDAMSKQLKELWEDFVVYMNAHNKEVEARPRIPGEARSYHNTKNAVNDNIADFIIRELQQITIVSTLRNNLAKIQGAFAEVMGALAGHVGYDLAMDTVEDFLQTNVWGQKSASVDIHTGYHLDFSVIAAELAKEQKRAEPFKVYKQGTDAHGTWYRYKTDYNAQGKVDFIFEYKTSDQLGNTAIQQARASMKNTSMQISKSNKPHANDISLSQGTSLALFLEFTQKQNYMPNIGNHFLNVFSHTDGQHYYKLRRDANRALEMALLYDGLTGLMRTQGTQIAEILMVEDKSATSSNKLPRVRFYSVPQIMSTLLNNVYDNQHIDAAIEISPRVEDIALRNEFQGERSDSGKDKTRDISARITKILEQARREYSFNVYIKKAFLNQIYQ